MAFELLSGERIAMPYDDKIQDFLRNIPEQQILRPAQVCAALSISKATLWRMVADGRFPPPKKLGKRAVGWPTAVVAAWIENLPEAGEE